MKKHEVTAENDYLDDRFNQERVRMHRQLYSAISHDLKTPLASIIGALEIYQRMKEKLSEEKRDALLLTALQEAYRLDYFVTNILDMGKLENDMVRAKKEPIHIGECIKNCIAGLDNRLRDSHVTTRALSGEVTIASDAPLLCRALTILLDNAVKYGGKPAHVTVSYGLDATGQCFIEVGDNGPGIPPAQMHTVFDKYTRFAKRDQQHAGTGLGLAICREIMRLLGGTVEVAAQSPNAGATFVLKFSA